MSVELPADVQPIVQKAIATGNCSDETDVLRRALRLYEQFEDRRESLKREIEIGIHSGDSVPANLVFQELEQFAQELGARQHGGIMKQPEFSPQSVADLREVLVFIAQDKPKAAERFVALLKEKCYFLARSPHVGTSRDELSPGLRYFSVGSYVIYYHPTDNGIRVERVLHGVRDVGLLFRESPD